MFLSVLISVYNAEKYIDRCIGSIVSQSFKEFELILVNDGSTDSSLQKCIQWKKKYPELVKVINKDNTGSLLSRRRCLEEAHGEYIYIMDADDYLLNENMFEMIKMAINRYKCDLVFFNATNSDNENWIYQYPYKDKEIFEGKDLNKLYERLVEGDSLNSLWNKVFSKNIVDWDVNYVKYEYVRNGTDFFQVIPIILNAKKVLYLNEAYYCYQISDNQESIVHKFNPYIYDSLKAGYVRLNNELARRGIMNVDLEKKLYKRFMMMSSTAVYKIRFARDREFNLYKYLKNIRQDFWFRDIYKKCNIHEIPLKRRMIIKILYRKMYTTLIILIKISEWRNQI